MNSVEAPVAALVGNVGRGRLSGAGPVVAHVGLARLGRTDARSPYGWELWAPL